MALIDCKNLTLGHDGKIVKSGLNFQVEKGDFLLIVGENGSGKTTLMKTLLSIIKPLSGEIIFSDGLSENEIGYLPQQSIFQNDFPATVYEIVLSGCSSRMGLRPFYNAGDKELAISSMKMINIYNFKDKSFRNLSGGQKQRVLLARALTSTRKVLLLDEPVTGLDPKVTNEMYEIIDNLNKKQNITIIMISHDIKEAIKYAKHILHIGEEVFFGTKDEYLNSNIGKKLII